MLFVAVEKGIKVKMDVKEKLVELLDGMFNGECCIDKTEAADFLIANGMTVARHGQWIYNIESGEYVCSACGENALSFRKDTLYGIDLYETCLTDYCPNCGARMDEEAQ